MRESELSVGRCTLRIVHMGDMYRGQCVEKYVKYKYTCNGGKEWQ